MKQITLVDGNALIWRAFYSVGTDGNGVTNGILRSIITVIDQFKNNDIIIFWDSGKSRWRREVYPKYKANRDEKKDKIDLEEVFRQVDISKVFIKSVGIKQIMVTGVEADDLISWFMSYLLHYNFYDEVVISTTDKDIWQLINKNVKVYDPIKKSVITENSVVDRFGVLPNLIPDFKALVGDKSDNIDGVKGIGDKTAFKLINELGCLTDILNERNHKNLTKSRRTAKILDAIDDAHLSYNLTKLSNFEEAKWYLDDNECKDLIYNISKVVQRDEVGIRLMREKFGNISFDEEKVSSLSLNTLMGIKPFIEKEKPREYPSLSLLDETIKKCDRCGLRGDCGEYGPTLADGYYDVEIMIIGRNPGDNEMVKGKPFVGRAGKRLDKLIEEVGLTRREIWITNVCKCYSEKNRPPTHGEIIACSEYLLAEINLLKPKFIMAFGNEAMSLVTPYGSGVTMHCGEIIDKPDSLILKQKINAKVAICVHPSSALRSKKYETEMQYATSKIKELVEEKC